MKDSIIVTLRTAGVAASVARVDAHIALMRQPLLIGNGPLVKCSMTREKDIMGDVFKVHLEHRNRFLFAAKVSLSQAEPVRLSQTLTPHSSLDAENTDEEDGLLHHFLFGDGVRP